MNRRRWLCLALCLCLFLPLCACSTMLNRQNSNVVRHSAAPSAEEASGALGIENYQSVVNAFVYIITQGNQSALLRFYDYQPEQVEEHLSAACAEILYEDPLGAYCVDEINYTVTQEEDIFFSQVQFSYRRTHEQVQNIISATGSSAIREALKTALSTFSGETVLRIHNFDGDTQFLLALLEQAFYQSPACAFSYPSAEIHIYPQQGRRRIAEILLSYDTDLDTLNAQKSQLAATGQDLLTAIHYDLAGEALALALANLVLSQCTTPSPEGDNAYTVLVKHEYNSKGLSLAMGFLSQLSNLPCQIVQGEKEEKPYFWIILETQNGFRHLDLFHMTQRDPQEPSAADLLTDSQMQELGYSWDYANTPICAN